MTNTIPAPTTHPTDIALGACAFHGLKVVRVFGRERDNKTGPVKTYWVVSDEYTKKEKRYQVAANELKV